MTAVARWLEMEEAIARILPSNGSAPQERVRLLALLTEYANAIVCEARRIEAVVPAAEERARALAWLDRPVFICGHHRSGTTLLQELLDRHPELLVLPSEGTYFSSFAYVAHSRSRQHEIDRFIAEWIARLIDPNQEPHFKLGRSEPNGNPYVLFALRILGWRAVLHELRPAWSQFALLLALAAAFKDVAAPASMPRMWVEKTPLNECHVKRFSAFSAAKFIHLVRDPRATFTSLIELHRVAGTHSVNPAEHAQAIGRSLRLAQRYEKKLKGRYLVVRYEDLTEAPEEEMERVRTFLGISPNASLLTPTMVGRSVRANSAFERSEPGVVQRFHRTPALLPSHATLISAFAASAARAHGYDVAPADVLTRCGLYLSLLGPNTYPRIKRNLRALSTSLRR